MTAITQLHQRALDATGQVVAGINADQYDLPTPDADWDVRALLDRMASPGNLGRRTRGRADDPAGRRPARR